MGDGATCDLAGGGFGGEALRPTSKQVERKLIQDNHQSPVPAPLRAWFPNRPTDSSTSTPTGGAKTARPPTQPYSPNTNGCSMSKNGNYYDNAAMESWNHSFKVKAVHGERYFSPETFELKQVAELSVC